MRRIWSILLALLILAAPVRAAEDEKWVALTFDDGPSGALTERLLDGLAARDVKATFFVCGYRVAEYPAALRRIAAEGLGFVFWDCDFVSDSCPQGTVYLGRPWRPTGKTAVLASRLGAHIAPEGFAGWNDRTDSDLARFAEAGNTGAGACPRGPWVQALDETQAGALLCAARRRCCPE